MLPSPIQSLVSGPGPDESNPNSLCRHFVITVLRMFIWHVEHLSRLCEPSDFKFSSITKSRSPSDTFVTHHALIDLVLQLRLPSVRSGRAGQCLELGRLLLCVLLGLEKALLQFAQLSALLLNILGVLVERRTDLRWAMMV